MGLIILPEKRSAAKTNSSLGSLGASPKSSCDSCRAFSMFCGLTTPSLVVGSDGFRRGPLAGKPREIGSGLHTEEVTLGRILKRRTRPVPGITSWSPTLRFGLSVEEPARCPETSCVAIAWQFVPRRNRRARNRDAGVSSSTVLLMAKSCYFEPTNCHFAPKSGTFVAPCIPLRPNCRLPKDTS